MPIDRQQLLSGLKPWVVRFEDDLRQQCQDHPELNAHLREQYETAKKAGRTAFALQVWRDGELTQSAVGWILSCVFVRFLEDNGLLERPYLSGLGEDRERAEHTRTAYFREHRTHSDNDYLAHIFREVGRLPGMGALLRERHNALWNASISPDAARDFLTFWRRIVPDSGQLAHAFQDPAWDTRFLGDLYQDLSDAARERFALLQTPDFVEEFILDRTLDPAIETFGLKGLRMIDPTCGSGHFLLGAFRRLLERWQKERPDLGDRELVVKALESVHGVDINPFAVAIARFRLLLAAWRMVDVKRLKDAPDFRVNLAVGDSLLHGARFDSQGHPYVIERQDKFESGDEAFKDELAHYFEVENPKELHRILGQRYHAVVGNPPYITAKDPALNQLYRKRYDSCHRQYTLSVPFMERFFDLALTGPRDRSQPAGFTGQITSNSFMKREFGKKLIEHHIPKWDLTHVLDTSGAYIPGHGTPTVILFGRNAKPAITTVRTVMGIKGEPATPDDPAKGKVWSAIFGQVDQPGSESEFVSAADTEREKLHKHPWSLQGGGAAKVMEVVENCARQTMGKIIEELGRTTATGDDDSFVLSGVTPERKGLRKSVVPYVVGEDVRDYIITSSDRCLFPYDQCDGKSVGDLSASLLHHFWSVRTGLRFRRLFGKYIEERGLNWWELSEFYPRRFSRQIGLAFAFVATHNHFAVANIGTVFNRHAPVILLPSDATEDDHFRLLGLLNSAVACFWMKQVFHCKGRNVPFSDWYEFNGTKLKQFPIPAGSPLLPPRDLDGLARELSAQSPDALAARDAVNAAALTESETAACALRARMITLQEELDWQCYRHYGLIEADDDLEWPEDRLQDLPPLALGERAFEIRMARQMAEGALETTWFERHKDAGSQPITELPAHWPAEYRALVERRLAFIEANKNLNLIERPEYKRRWSPGPSAKRQEAALEKWLLTRLETYFHDADRMIDGADEAATAAKRERIRPLRARFPGGSQASLVSVRQLAGVAQADPQWMEAATVFTGRADFEVAKLVEKLVLAQSVPFLPALRYKPAGLRKRIEWEKTWDLQRREDAVEERVRREHPDLSQEERIVRIRRAQKEEIGEIPVPPKYAGKDFTKNTYWKLRGKRDVPKERWVLYPGAEGGHDASPVVAWAGWDHAQQAKALTSYYQLASETWGWDPERLAPLLTGLKDLLPWLHQWHHDLDPEYGDSISTTYQQFYETERHALRLADEGIERIRLGAESS